MSQSLQSSTASRHSGNASTADRVWQLQPYLPHVTSALKDFIRTATASASNDITRLSVCMHF